MLETGLSNVTSHQVSALQRDTPNKLIISSHCLIAYFDLQTTCLCALHVTHYTVSPELTTYEVLRQNAFQRFTQEEG